MAAWPTCAPWNPPRPRSIPRGATWWPWPSGPTRPSRLLQENERLRKLLQLRDRLQTPAKAAQVIYDAADPYTRRVMIDQGQMAGIVLGSPVMDESGMLGQVTRVHPLLSEVTLLIDRDQAIPVMNLRTGARGVAYGDPVIAHGGGMEPALHAQQCRCAGG